MIEKGPWGKIKVEFNDQQQATIERALTWLAGEADSRLFEKRSESEIADAVGELREHVEDRLGELQQDIPLPEHSADAMFFEAERIAEDVVRTEPEMSAQIFHSLLQRVRDPGADYFMVPATQFINGLEQASTAYIDLGEATLGSNIRELADNMRRELEEIG